MESGTRDGGEDPPEASLPSTPSACTGAEPGALRPHSRASTAPPAPPGVHSNSQTPPLCVSAATWNAAPPLPLPPLPAAATSSCTAGWSSASCAAADLCLRLPEGRRA